jgi:hypothetical protein
LAAYNFEIKYKPRIKNPSNTPSQRPDFFEDREKEEDVGLLPTLQHKLKVNALKTNTRLASLISLKDSPRWASLSRGKSPSMDLRNDSQVSRTYYYSRRLVLRAVQAEDIFNSLTPLTTDLIQKLQKGNAFSQQKIVSADGISKPKLTDLSRNQVGVDSKATRN